MFSRHSKLSALVIELFHKTICVSVKYRFFLNTQYSCFIEKILPIGSIFKTKYNPIKQEYIEELKINYLIV